MPVPIPEGTTILSTFVFGSKNWQVFAFISPRIKTQLICSRTAVFPANAVASKRWLHKMREIDV